MRRHAQHREWLTGIITSGGAKKAARLGVAFCFLISKPGYAWCARYVVLGLQYKGPYMQRMVVKVCVVGGVVGGVLCGVVWCQEPPSSEPMEAVSARFVYPNMRLFPFLCAQLSLRRAGWCYRDTKYRTVCTCALTPLGVQKYRWIVLLFLLVPVASVLRLVQKRSSASYRKYTAHPPPAYQHSYSESISPLQQPRRSEI